MPILTKINTNVIADNAVTAAKTAPSAEEESGGLGLSTAAAGNLTGTISTQQLQLADAFTLTGDLTVNDDLILGKVRDDGTGQSITGSGKTLTGTGTLTMGSYLEEPLRAEKLGGNFTPVVGGNLGEAVTFPAGHIIQVQGISSNTRNTTGSTSWNTKWGKSVTITPKKASSNIWLSASFTAHVNHHAAYFDFYKNASDVTETYNLSGLSYGCADIAVGVGWLGMCITFLDTCPENSTTEKTYSWGGRHSNSGGTLYLGGGDNAGVTLTVMEIAT